MRRFLYVYADLKGSDTDMTPGVENGRFYVGKILTDRDAIADLAPLFLGARYDGRRITRIEVGRPDEGAALDTVHSLTTTYPNNQEASS
ncbi:hypothetical protein [Streptomyces sp. NPDC057002]|uniref:hypothetical protein n=1 Tax=Streptomyces sp. NPDC057002 TaxID=3345992 RepID=UPI003624C970